MRDVGWLVVGCALFAGWLSATELQLAGPELGDPDHKAVEAPLWVIDTVDDTRNVGAHLSLAYSNTSHRHFISYYESINQDLWIAWSLLPAHQHSGNCGPDDTWLCIVLDSVGDVGMYNHIAAVDVTAYTSIALSYYDATNHALKIMKGSIPHTDDVMATYFYTIQSGTPAGDLWKGKHTSVAIDADWEPIVVYQNGNTSGSIDEELMIARPTTENTGNCGEGELLDDWQCDSLYAAEGTGQYADIDLDDLGNPAIAFYDQSTATPIFAFEFGPGGNCGPSNTWACLSILNGSDATGRFLSIAVEGDGTPHLAYYNASNESVEYATLASGGGNCGAASAWTCSGIASMGASLQDMGISLDLTPDAVPIIAYQDASSALGPSTLAIARPWFLLPQVTPNCGPPGTTHPYWVCEWLDSGGATLSEARGLSLHVSELSHAMIAYHELDDYPIPAEGALKLAAEPDPWVFSDGFENGTLDLWSLVQRE